MEFKNAVLKCIYTRRSVRDYLDKPVPESVIKDLLNAAVMAPSAMHTLPWNFSIVTSKEKIKEYSAIALVKLGTIKGKIVNLAIKSIFYNAPLLIFISGKRNYEWLAHDVNLAVENMFLAAKSLGLGSCYIGFGKSLDKSNEARKELGIPDDFELSAALVFGYPKKEKKEIPKRQVKILKWVK